MDGWARQSSRTTAEPAQEEDRSVNELQGAVDDRASVVEFQSESRFGLARSALLLRRML